MLRRASFLAIALSAAFLAAGCGVRTDLAQGQSATGGQGSSEAVAPGGVQVQVVDAMGRPVPGATVQMRNAQGQTVGQASVASADGLVRLKGVPAGGGYSVAAASGKGQGLQSGLAVEGEAPLMVQVLLVSPDAAKGTVTGVLLDAVDGRPLEGATVAVQGTTITRKTGADGSFTLSGVPAGAPTLTAQLRGYRAQKQAITLKGGASGRLDLRLAPEGDGARLGHVVVTTASGILEFDRGGLLTNQIKSAAFTARPLANGNFLVASGTGVAELTSMGAVAWAYRPLLLGRLGKPQGAYKCSSGTMIIADTEQNRVIEVSSGQKVERVLRAALLRPTSVERLEPSTNLLIADSGNHRVVELSDQGVLLWQAGDGTDKVLKHPAFATRLPNGNTLIADTGNHRVLEVTKDQKLAWAYGGDGKRETCFYPNSATRLPNGNTLIADTGNRRVIEVNAQGALVGQIDNLDAPTFAERI